MATLYIRKRSGYVTYIHNKEELKELEYNLVPTRDIIIGDLAFFNPSMIQMLLKLIEENASIISCYTSVDIDNPILISRFSKIVKEPLSVQYGHDDEAWSQAKRDYSNVRSLQGGLTRDKQLRLPLLPYTQERLYKIV